MKPTGVSVGRGCRASAKGKMVLRIRSSLTSFAKRRGTSAPIKFSVVAFHASLQTPASAGAAVRVWRTALADNGASFVLQCGERSRPDAVGLAITKL